MNKKAKARRGKGIIDATANMLLSNKHIRALPNEKHQIIYLPDGTYNSARYSGPGTQLETRLKRGDKPRSYEDTVAEAHDLRYALAQTEADVRTADSKMVQLIVQGRRSGKDSNFSLNQAEFLKAKILLEDKLGVPKSWFASYGREGKSQNVIDLYQNKLNEIQQQGFGVSGQGIHERHAKAMPMSVIRAKPIAVLRVKNM
jgi:hypothetical protein